ncbi:MAG: hypothetical protein ACM3Y8_11910 [Byssovorax cruenta]
MKHITFFALILILALTTTACGAQPVPTVNAADVQHTAEAAAFTMVAQTQEAMPTNTPIPPTETPTNTPVPTDTPAAVSTVATLGSATVPTTAATISTGATVDPCATRVLSYSPKGEDTIIRIANLTKAPVTVSVYLNETAGAGECGYRSYNLTKYGDVVITDLVQGCYNLWAWSTDNKIHVNAGGFGCINNPDKWTFEISENTIKFTQ